MSNIDKQALREEFRFMQVHYGDPADRARQVIYIAAEALLDELETKEEQRANWFQMAQKLGEDLDATEKRNAEQREYYEGVIADGSKHIAELESKNGYLRTIAHEQNELAIRASLDSNNATVEMGRLHKRIAELEAKLANPVLLPKTNGYWNEQEKAYEEAITLAKRQVRLAGFSVEDM
ncbi:TPA: ead/Ea22-like family protein [Salmonella enterica subsp. diarizonae serovar 50:k:z35]